MKEIKKEELTKVGERTFVPYFWKGKTNNTVTLTIFKDREGKIWEKFPDTYVNLLYGGGFIEDQYEDTGYVDGVAKNGYARMV